MSLPEAQTGFAGGRSGAKLALFLCMLASLALPAWLFWPTNFSPREWGVIFGAMVGGLLTYGLLPVMWWAFRGFRYERAGGPIILWIVLLLVLGGLSIKGAAVLSGS